MEEYLDLNHAVEVHAVKEERRKTVYLPHHAVVREDKETTKVRVVFNASSKGGNGLSLNDCLMVGPTIQPELRHLVMRWRLNSICLEADIVKMYRQIKVHEDDADCQRFIWRNNPEDKVRDFKLITVTFGTACAPFLASRALKQIALDDGAKYPEAGERVMNEFYMDDLMTGCESVKQGIEIYKQMNELLNKGGFVLEKWVSNNDELLEKLKEPDKVKELSTVLAQIEACLNSRPLWRLSRDLNDANVMTPGRFLIGEPLVTPRDENLVRHIRAMMGSPG
ncbi:hypothetical protein K1T71_012465 [Dendrolimus kikuchii]|uniref:Uncharacterized protein n=1 Tax=Dendrolimus kikuchii TaxID=765133 RepID=A0ACC1CJM2_9NEOP|nr:hypothetical protein K1T71_012465 [Dendrolimus kikuchii]